PKKLARFLFSDVDCRLSWLVRITGDPVVFGLLPCRLGKIRANTNQHGPQAIDRLFIDQPGIEPLFHVSAIESNNSLLADSEDIASLIAHVHPGTGRRVDIATAPPVGISPLAIRGSLAIEGVVA